MRLMAASVFPDKVHHRCTVDELITKVDLDKQKEQLTRFSTFHNRYFNSQHGVDAVDWLYEQIRDAIRESGNPLATVRYVRHTAWAQPSLIVSLPGIIRGDTVVVGAHLDSVISNDRGAGRAPGAGESLILPPSQREVPNLLFRRRRLRLYDDPGQPSRPALRPPPCRG